MFLDTHSLTRTSKDGMMMAMGCVGGSIYNNNNNNGTLIVERQRGRHRHCCWVAPVPRRQQRVARLAHPRSNKSIENKKKQLDDSLSMRPLQLDHDGYFIIQIDRENDVIVAEHYRNVINDQGLACDEETGEVIACGSAKQIPSRKFTGRTAKEISVEILERESGLCSRLEHANYLGREFQKAEFALEHGTEYVQD